MTSELECAHKIIIDQSVRIGTLEAWMKQLEVAFMAIRDLTQSQYPPEEFGVMTLNEWNAYKVSRCEMIASAVLLKQQFVPHINFKQV